MKHLVISACETLDDATEVVERKGLGHPDTICDALAETLSRNLCREYRSRFGTILHHNVDKALLAGGRAVAAFGGGEVIDPINIYLAGRAIAELGTERMPTEEIAVEGARAWLRANMHALDAERHVRVHVLVRPGSQDLQALFQRREGLETLLANDTSVGVGYAPLSPLEQLVLAAEKRINGRDRAGEQPAWGEDVKVMGVRCGEKVQLTIACAMIGRYLADLDDYLGNKAALEHLVRQLAAEHGFPTCEVHVNAADSASTGDVYLTVTGTSAEAGDDGQVGRGNRVNGLITFCRPMSLEAAAGKNPVTHVGKIYNVVARQIAESLVTELPELESARCLVVSRIGQPLAEPALLHIGLATRTGRPPAELRQRVEAIAADRLARIPNLIDDFVAGDVEIY